jgi:hypothetical protein
MERRFDGLIKFLGHVVSFDELVFRLGWVSPYVLVSPFSNGSCPFVFFLQEKKKKKRRL